MVLLSEYEDQLPMCAESKYPMITEEWVCAA